MLVTCPKECKMGQSTSDASLDISSNEAVCNNCGIVVPVSSFAKRSMEVNGDVIKEKKLYGKVHMGIERSTFIIDPEGKLVKEWRKVKVKTHIDELLEFANSI